MSINNITSSNSWYNSSTENCDPCPYCAGTHQKQAVGTMYLDGNPRSTYLCTSCNKTYVGIPNYAKSLAQEAISSGAAQSVGYTISSGLTGTVTGTSTSNQYITNWQPPQYTMEVKDHNTAFKLDTVNNNLMSLQNSINFLVEEIKRLANQNNSLLEQIKTDPLIPLRKAVSEFDLK